MIDFSEMFNQIRKLINLMETLILGVSIVEKQNRQILIRQIKIERKLWFLLKQSFKSEQRHNTMKQLRQAAAKEEIEVSKSIKH